MNRKARTAVLLFVGLPLAQSFVSKNVWRENKSSASFVLESSKQEPQARQPWDVFRFVSQSSKFVSLNPLSRKLQARTIKPGDVLWTPGSTEFTMAPLDDVVMGGTSSSTFDNDTGLWKGKASDANNGGFIGIRSTPSFEWNMENCKGVELKLKTTGETKRFKFVVRDSTEFNGVCWTSSFDCGGTGGVMKLFSPAGDNDGTTTVRIPFDKQIPTIFAKTVSDRTFRKDNVVGVQLAYSKFEYDGDLNPNFTLGDAQLQILEMSAY